MVQEVQTSVNQPIETTLETIQAVGTSSVKIVEGRQTTGGHYNGFRIKAGGEESITVPDSKQITLSKQDSFGNLEYSIINGGIRVPQEGTYEIKAECQGGNIGGNVQYVHHIKVGILNTAAGNRDLFTVNTGNNNDRVTQTQQVNLGKFDVISVVSYSSGTTGNGATSRDKITITKI